MLLILLTLRGVYSEMSITNVDQQPVANLIVGEARITTGNSKIIHQINLTRLQQSVEAWEATVASHLNPQLEMTPLISHAIKEIQSEAAKLHPKPARVKRWDALDRG